MRSRIDTSWIWAALGIALVASPATAQIGDRLQIHGYLSQGMVQSSDLPVHGMTDEGTADYRNAAILFRYLVSDNDAITMKLGHRRLGQSVLTRNGDEVALRWAFYQRRLGDFSVRLGRVPMPGGIFNETRDVGTLHPFYRAPASFYLEGIETIDGAVVSHYLDLGRWSLETSLAGGGFGIDYAIATPAGPILHQSREEGAVTAQVWLNTPIQGVRVGASTMRWNGADDEKDPLTWDVAADAVSERGSLRGEVKFLDMETTSMTFYYGQASVRVVGGLHVNGQAEFQEQERVAATGTQKFTAVQDLALGLSYKLSSNLVFKFEAHDYEGSTFDVFVNPMQPEGTRYYITSVSVAF